MKHEPLQVALDTILFDEDKDAAEAILRDLEPGDRVITRHSTLHNIVFSHVNELGLLVCNIVIRSTGEVKSQQEVKPSSISSIRKAPKPTPKKSGKKINIGQTEAENNRKELDLESPTLVEWREFCDYVYNPQSDRVLEVTWLTRKGKEMTAVPESISRYGVPSFRLYNGSDTFRISPKTIIDWRYE
jgi:hypothetical protein